MSLFEAKIEIAAAAAEQASDFLAELETEQWSVFEDVISRRAWLLGIFPDTADAHARAAELVVALPAECHARAPELRELPEAEWRDSYKAHFHAWQFGRLHWVPIWQKPEFRLPEGDAVLWLDPGLAFGTGNHETTRLCVERLVQHAANRGPGGRVIDAGCGSGILALSAAKLGFREVVGFDNDAEAVRVSEENAALNSLTGQVRFFVGDLVSGLQGQAADLLMANILANVLIRFAPELVAAVAPGGTLILSGILVSECSEVQAAFSRAAPEWEQTSRTLGDWSDVLLRRPRSPSSS